MIAVANLMQTGKTSLSMSIFISLKLSLKMSVISSQSKTIKRDRSVSLKIRRQTGFSYVFVIVLVTILGLVAASSIKLGSLLQRNEAEKDLLEIGAAFSEALRSYDQSSEEGQSRSPTSLDQLIKDPRSAAPKRHLRKLFVDPMTGSSEWGIVRGVDKVSIIGVYSLSDARPIKLAKFPPGLEHLENKTRISDWKFLISKHVPGAVNAIPSQPGNLPPNSDPNTPAFPGAVPDGKPL